MRMQFFGYQDEKNKLKKKTLKSDWRMLHEKG